ncbi:hypothetical protein [Micromonospora sp. LH3U1]|uniref:hypothetical protein n=1 Tax=Micromonospora sp. LH3U1 TaxID=3018339 RepID=UPI00234AE57D|nr:hypothetical protein [Micromonospora sp. LH3U1]WCN80932.1 hypothetical protein PCA76_29270 [Micromonospora sp. LH3U1]
MSRVRPFLTAGLLVLVGAALVLFVLFLRSEGLERAGWWATVAAAVFAAAGLVVAYLAWRHPVTPGAGGGSARAAEGSVAEPGKTVVSGERSIGSMSSGTAITGDGNVVGDGSAGGYHGKP